MSGKTGWVRPALAGAAAGLVNGLFGGGGGMVLVPLLSGWCVLEERKAALLAPKPPRESKRTKRQKIQEIIQLAMENGMSAEEVAEQLHVEVKA